MDERVKKIVRKVKIVDVICFTVPGILAVLGMFVDPVTAIMFLFVGYSLTLFIIRKEYKKGAVNNCLYKKHDPRLAEAVERAIYPKREETDEEKARYDYLAGDYISALTIKETTGKHDEIYFASLFEFCNYDSIPRHMNRKVWYKYISEYEAGNGFKAPLLYAPYMFYYAFGQVKYKFAEYIVNLEIANNKPYWNPERIFADMYRKYRRGVTEYMLGKYDEAKADLAPMAACPKLGASKSAQYYLDKMATSDKQAEHKRHTE